jgi:hypothetical protein
MDRKPYGLMDGSDYVSAQIRYCIGSTGAFGADQGFDRLLLACVNSLTITYAELRQ